MKRKIFFTLIFLMLITSWGYGETIFLKNGKMIKGEILEDSDSGINVKQDGQVQTIYRYQILRIVKDGEDVFGLTEQEKEAEKKAAEKRELVLRLMEANKARENINIVFQQIISEAPEETREELKKIFKTDEIIERVVPIYEKYYTIDELREIVNFYKSPAGSKHVRISPTIMEETLRSAFEYFQEKADEFPQQLKSP